MQRVALTANDRCEGTAGGFWTSSQKPPGAFALGRLFPVLKKKENGEKCPPPGFPPVKGEKKSKKKQYSIFQT
jgi:hypothetical protein